MLINSIKSAEEFKNLQLPEEYLDNLFENSPGNVLKVISRVIAVVLRKQNVPENEIQDLVDQIERKKHMALFDDWEGFDVQEERRIGKAEGIVEGEETKLIKLVCKKMAKGKSVEEIAEVLEEDVEHIREIYDTAVQFAPDYDVEKIFEALPKKELVKEG
jgi:flagellar motor component MotA